MTMEHHWNWHHFPLELEFEISITEIFVALKIVPLKKSKECTFSACCQDIFLQFLEAKLSTER